MAKRGNHCASRVVFAPLDHIAEAVAAGGGKAVVVTTKTVMRLYGSMLLTAVEATGLRCSVCVIEGGEANKAWAAVESVLTACASAGLGRDDTVIAAGGGLLTDVSGLAASLYKRGVQRINVPTTLLGQVDAGIGFKTAINFSGRRNLVGLYGAPRSVLIDQRVLRTLPYVELRQGLAEIAKVAITVKPELWIDLQSIGARSIEDRSAFASVHPSLVQAAVDATLSSLSEDAHETLRADRALDFGHTFSPELESASHFSIRHGDAVAIDILLSSALALVIGALEAEDFRAIVALFQRLDLPLSSRFIDVEMLERAQARCSGDRGGMARWPVPTRIGEVAYLDKVSRTALTDAIELGREAAAGYDTEAVREREGEP